MKITIHRNNSIPVYVQICQQIRKGIFDGSLVDGFLLPSERKLAAEIGVHRNTVTRAYMELKSEGLIEARQGQGYRIRYRSIFEEMERSGQKKKAVHWEALIEDRYENIRSSFDELYSLSYEENLIPFGGGVAAREPYPAEEIAEYFEKALKGSTYFHSPYQGDPDLRREIVKLLDARGIRVREGNIQIFSEANQTMDFLNSLLLSPGDTVITADMLSADVYRSIQLSGGRLVTVPMDEEGMVCDHLEALIERERPKYIYVDSSFNNPTGAVLSTVRRQKLLELSYRYRIPIIEEDESSDLYYDAPIPPSIRSMDTGSNVIYLYSFSLTFRPGLGISFVAADHSITERLHNMVSVRLAALDWTPQMIMREYLRSGQYLRRLEDYRRVCRGKRDRMREHLQRLAQRFGIEFSVPSGGVYFWVKLPAGLDAQQLLTAAQQQGVTFIPGHLFDPAHKTGRDHIRLNFSYPGPEQIDEGMQMLERAFEQMLQPLDK
ncbi:MAG: PLP-dependent aminotransferase family protein [Firmicutes bacterium]|nr:PLP-dependent aminotransferase family protein [Bacillota bacterium]